MDTHTSWQLLLTILFTMIHTLIHISPYRASSRQPHHHHQIYHQKKKHVSSPINHDVNIYKRGQESREEERHDMPTVMTVMKDDRAHQLSQNRTTLVANEQREPLVKTHRRTCAADWNDGLHQALSHPPNKSNNTQEKSTIPNTNTKKHRKHHRRTMALTNEEFTEVTMICDELHGPCFHPRYKTSPPTTWSQ